MLRRAFEVQLAGEGLSIVEVLSTCPVGWGMTPTESMEHLARDVVQTYPLGVLVDRREAAARRPGSTARGLTMEHATIFGGFGGQGLLFAGHVLAQAAVIEGRDVSWMPSYGPEMRGGTASCTVIVADRPIGSPIVDTRRRVVALNPPSLAKFEPLLVPGGLLVAQRVAHRGGAPTRRTSRSSACRARRSPGPPVTTGWSASSRSVRLIARRPIVDEASIREALVELVGRKHPELVAADLDALAAGALHASAAGVRGG